MLSRRLVLLLPLGQFKPAQGEVDYLTLKMNEFAKEYNYFVQEKAKGLLDLRQAKRVSRKFRELESSGWWPKNGR